MKVNGEQLSIHGRQKNEIQLVKECLKKKKKRKQKGENLMGRRKQKLWRDGEDKVGKRK